MRLQDIMSTPVESITATTPVAEARTIMKRAGIRHLVVATNKKVQGVVSARDLVGAAPDARAVDLMATPVVTATPRTTVREAANLLRGHSVGCLPIVEAGRVVGVVTISDLLELLGRGAERPVEQSTRWTLKGRGPRKTRPTPDGKGLAYSR